jgi:predicted NBD/HSP70 family sugar kinase
MAETTSLAAGGPQLLRAMNERAILDHIRRHSPVSRAELAQKSRLSKPTVSLALSSLELSGLIRKAGRRTGQPGPAAALYEIRPTAGYVLAIDVGRVFVRTAVADLTGAVLERISTPMVATAGLERVAEMVRAADALLARAEISRADVTQTVVGSPGVYDAQLDALVLTGNNPGWDEPVVLTAMREAFGENLVVENDVDAAALAELDHGHGQSVDDFAYVTVGTGVGVGLVLGGSLRRGSHGAAGEIGFLSLGDSGESSSELVRHGTFEALASAAGVIHAARLRGLTTVATAQDVFLAAEDGDQAAKDVVQAEAALLAKALVAIITVVDPQLLVLGGGIGKAAGFVETVAAELGKITPVAADLRVSALGDDAILDGCLSTGIRLAWDLVIQKNLRTAEDERVQPTS